MARDHKITVRATLHLPNGDPFHHEEVRVKRGGWFDARRATEAAIRKLQWAVPNMKDDDDVRIDIDGVFH